MFISGLNVHVRNVTSAQAAEYYDDFHATGTHTWENGLPTGIDEWTAAGHPDLRWVSWVDADGTSRENGQLIGGYPANAPGRLGYQISDEPHDMAELLQIEAGLNAVRAADPDALLIVNFSIYANDIDQQLDHYGQHMDGDVVSYDSYTLKPKEYGRMNKFRLAGLRAGLPYWRYLKAYKPLSHGWVPRPPEDMRWDAMAGMLYGYTGHTWFVYQIAPSNPDMESRFFSDRVGYMAAPKTPEWAVAAQLNKEMANLGRSITQLTSTDVRYVLGPFSLLLPRGTEAWVPGAGGDRYMKRFSTRGGDAAIGVFRDDADDRYFMIQNANHPAGSWPTDTDDPIDVMLEFDFANAPQGFDPTRLETLNAKTGNLESWALTPLGPTSATLSFSLEAGDAVLLKYATGRPFARR
jgi:hypothetical protein